ncbi:MAG: transglutaminase-like domain-containing protein [Vicinamibacteria bacterium]
MLSNPGSPEAERTRNRISEAMTSVFEGPHEPPEAAACLAASALCDFDHPLVAERARRLAAGAADPVEAAVRVYRFVREEIAFGFDTWVTPASETLAKGFGMCSNKAILGTALYRSLGLPAAFGLVISKIAELKPFLIGAEGEAVLREYVDLFGERVVHIFTLVHLDGRWLEADASADSRTLITILKAHLLFPQVLQMWDGRSDHGIHPRLCYGDRKVVRRFADLDARIRGLCPFDEGMGPLRAALEEAVRRAEAASGGAVRP